MKRVFWKIGLAAVVFVVIALVIAAYSGYYNGLVKEISDTGSSEQAGLNSRITICADFIELMTTYGNQYFENGGLVKDSEYLRAIVYDAESDEYNMDMTKGAEYSTEIGNITGLGPVPQSDIDLQELNLAISYNYYFSDFLKRLPEVTWIYYTSENDFVLMYPWISSKEFKYSQDVKKLPFYSVAIPENDKLREAVWTPVYTDAAGKGHMITLSSPIYYGDDFKGLLSLDYTTEALSGILKSKFDGYLIDSENNIICASNLSEANGSVLSLKAGAGLSDDDVQAVESAKFDVVQKAGNHYIYKARLYDAPWTVLIVVPLYSIIGKALLLTLPEIIIGILLLFAYIVLMNLQKAEERLKNASLTDPLTGLNNRRYLDTLIEKEIARADRYKESFSIVSLDLDRFKRVNDTWGHPIGDEVLKLTANTVKDSIRESDILVRMGGEEFAVLLPHTDADAAYKIAERARKAIEEANHPIAGKVTASFGVAERQSGESYNSLYRRVDKALYKAKDSGRNCVIVYEETTENLAVTIKMEWNTAWECGEANIDRQHREIVEFGNRLIGMASTSTEGMEQQLDVMVECLSEHFSYEEGVLEKIKYPDLNNHAEIHRKLIEKTMEIKKSSMEGKIKPSILFSFIMDDAIIGHMLEEDIKFFPYLK